MDEEIQGIKISEIPNAPSVNNADVVTGLHEGDNANFTFSRIMAWFREAVAEFYVPTSREINGYPLEGDVNLTASDVDGVEERILATVETNSEKLSQHNYSVGQCLMMGHNFYKVIAPIRINDTLTEGTNIEKTTVSARIVEVEGEIPTTPDDIGATAESVVAQVEAGPTSGHSYAQGNYLIYEGTLYKAIVPISVGDTIEEGTNVETVTIGGELEEIRGDIPTQPSDIGAQGKILVSGLLKGNGVGGISAAQPGTDYGTYSKPSGGIPASDLANGVIPTVPSASIANPQMDGTASPGSTGQWSDGGHVHPTDTTRAAASLEINGHPLTGDFDLTAADVGALASGGTAVNSKRLVAVHNISGNVGWYHFLDITSGVSNSRQITILVSNGYTSAVGLLQVYFTRTGGGISTAKVAWLSTAIPPDNVRWQISSDTLSLYAYKPTDNNGALTFTVLSAINRVGTNLAEDLLVWDDTAITEPTTANNAVATTYNDLDRLLWFPTQAVSAGMAQQILSISDAKITADYVLAEITFADPAYITGSGSWASAAGSFTLTGTATAATTADILLVRKGN